MSYTVVIPARYASTRLPGKPLEDIAGMSMLERVWTRSCASKASRVLVATDDERIETHCATFEAEVVMTAADHASGTDRLAEVVDSLALPDEAVVVNVQGDEPLIPPAVIDQVADNLQAHTQASIATLCEQIADAAEFHNPNAVKVVFSEDGYALYFSRAPIPWPRDAQSRGRDAFTQGSAWRHLGIYAYRAGFLRRFRTWPPAPLERVESLEQLRALQHGERIHVAEACVSVPAGVDTQEDLQRLRERIAAEGDG